MSPPYVLSSLAGIIVPLVYDSGEDEADGMGMGLGLGALICLMSFISAIALVILDNKATEYDMQLERNYSLIARVENVKNRKPSARDQMKNPELRLSSQSLDDSILFSPRVA